MNVREIVSEWLKANDYDGLCSYECGCGLNDFMPCDQGCEDCSPAYRAVADEDDMAICPCEIGDVIYMTDKARRVKGG